MLAATLLGGQVFAADYIPTTVEGAVLIAGNYYGDKNTVGDASDGDAIVSQPETGGGDKSNTNVYGGYALTAATNNKITMTGGQVSMLCGGYGSTTASGNTVIMTGGKASGLFGGYTQTGMNAENNVVIVAGDCEITTILYGALSRASGSTAKDNKVYLVGKGATATIADAQGNTDTYTGGKLSLDDISAGGAGQDKSGNSIDIYGTGIEAMILENMQILNFHIADLDDGATPMITLKALELDLTGFLVPTDETPSPELSLTFDALGSMAWQPGASVTLVNAAYGIKIDEALLNKEYNIYSHDNPATIVGTGKIELEQNNRILKLTVQGVPEPTTGTLGLLALAGLAARRRRK